MNTYFSDDNDIELDDELREHIEWFSFSEEQLERKYESLCNSKPMTFKILIETLELDEEDQLELAEILEINDFGHIISYDIFKEVVQILNQQHQTELQQNGDTKKIKQISHDLCIDSIISVATLGQVFGLPYQTQHYLKTHLPEEIICKKHNFEKMIGTLLYDSTDTNIEDLQKLPANDWLNIINSVRET
jgi:hypothetical protein